MRDIAAAAIEQAVRDLCIEANRHLPGDIRRAVQEAAGAAQAYNRLVASAKARVALEVAAGSLSMGRFMSLNSVVIL